MLVLVLVLVLGSSVKESSDSSMTRFLSGFVNTSNMSSFKVGSDSEDGGGGGGGGCWCGIGLPTLRSCLMGRFRCFDFLFAANSMLESSLDSLSNMLITSPSFSFLMIISFPLMLLVLCSINVFLNVYALFLNGFKILSHALEENTSKNSGIMKNAF